MQGGGRSVSTTVGYRAILGSAEIRRFRKGFGLP